MVQPRRRPNGPRWRLDPAELFRARQFSEHGVVVLCVMVALGAWAARPLPFLAALIGVAWGLVGRRPWMVAVGLALTASALAAGALAGAAPVAAHAFTGPATLVTDPVPVAGGLRAEVRTSDGDHVEVTARGRAAGGLRRRLAGEVVALEGDVVPRPDNAPWLVRRHIVGTVDARSVRLLDEGGPPARVANGFRRVLTDGAAVLPEDQQALFTGLVFGDDRAESAEVIDDFRASGLTHLLAVSGENVAFVLVAAGPVLRRLGPRSRLVVAVGLLLFFALATRFEPSVLRATAMALIATVTTSVGMPISARRTLALAVTALLLIDPLLITSVGFQLSVAASAGIIVASRPIAARVPGPRVVAELTGVTVAAQIGVAPVLIPVFGALPIAALPANLLAVPAAGPVMVWGLTAGVVAGVGGPAVAAVVHLPTRLLLGWIATVARLAGSVPLGALAAGHAVVLALLTAVGVVAHRLRVAPPRRGPVVVRIARAAGRTVLVMGVLGVVVGAGTRPAPRGPRAELGAGATLFVGDGRGTVLVVDGRSHLDVVLGGLRREGLHAVDVVVQRTRSTRLDADVAILRGRVTPRLLLRPRSPSASGSNATGSNATGSNATGLTSSGSVSPANDAAGPAGGDRSAVPDQVVHRGDAGADDDGVVDDGVVEPGRDEKVEVGDLLVVVEESGPVLRVSVTDRRPAANDESGLAPAPTDRGALVGDRVEWHRRRGPSARRRGAV